MSMFTVAKWSVLLAGVSTLAIAQSEHKWLSNELIEEVAVVLGMPPVAVAPNAVPLSINS